MFLENEYKSSCAYCTYINCSFCEYRYLRNEKIPELEEKLSRAKCESFDIKANELINMFDEDFNFSEFDFDGDDIISKIGKLIYKEKFKGE